MAIVYLRGLPWEATEDDVFSALRAMLPKQISILDLLLPLDSRARPSGDAYIELVPDLAAAEALRLLDGTKFSQRYLEARLSNVKERETARKRTEAAADRVAVLAKHGGVIEPVGIGGDSVGGLDATARRRGRRRRRWSEAEDAILRARPAETQDLDVRLVQIDEGAGVEALVPEINM